MPAPVVTRVVEAEEYLRALESRRREAARVERIDNSSLPVGSCMYYYCKLCGAPADRLGESEWRAPRQYCAACQEMVDRGYSSSLGKFVGLIDTR